MSFVNVHNLRKDVPKCGHVEGTICKVQKGI